MVIPNAEPASPAQLTNAFETDLARLLSDDVVLDDIANVPAPDVVPVPAPATATAAATPHVPRAGPATVVTAAQAIDRLPVLDALPRPPGLLTATAPYILTMTANGREWIRIDCSHEPSLELLSAYLKKWTKTNPNDSRRVSVPDFLTAFSHFTSLPAAHFGC